MNDPRPITPAEREAKKTEAQQAEDIAYTINHALACTATDFIDPYFGNLTQRYLGKRYSVGCGHDHSKDSAHHDHNHHHHHGSHLKHWWIGEVVGDFGAVPVTVGMQRHFPGFMNGLRTLLEPLLGGFFRRGAERSARHWAQAQGLSAESQEYKEQADAIYRYEIDHLPQAFMWTASSVALNLGTQRLVGNQAPLWHLVAGKTVGAGISASLVVGGRGFFPAAAHAWDTFTSEHLFLPATKVVVTMFEEDRGAVDRMAEKKKRLHANEWVERTQGHESGMALGK